MSEIVDSILAKNQNAVLVIHSSTSDTIQQEKEKENKSKNSQAVICLPQAIPSIKPNQTIWKPGNKKNSQWNKPISQWRHWMSIPFQRNLTYLNQIEKRYMRLLEKTNPVNIPKCIEDYSFQKRFSLSEDESVLMRFTCGYMNSIGFCEITEHYIGYHGNKGKIWIESLSTIMNITEKSTNCLLFETTENEYQLHHLSNCHMIVELLRVLACHLHSSNPHTCKMTQSKQWKQIHNQQIILERQLLISINRLYDYLLSYQFYRLFLLSCNKYGIRIGRWLEEEETNCCKSYQREIQYQSTYKLWKKQVQYSIHQYQQLTNHQPSKTILFSTQSTISNIPLLDPFQIEVGWIIQEREKGINVQISYSVNCKSSFVSTTICPILQREIEQEWNQWVKMIKDKEEKRAIGTKKDVSNRIVGKENCNQNSTLGWFFLILVAMFFKYFRI